jgi:hypothetical protein
MSSIPEALAGKLQRKIGHFDVAALARDMATMAQTGEGGVCGLPGEPSIF